MFKENFSLIENYPEGLYRCIFKDCFTKIKLLIFSKDKNKSFKTVFQIKMYT